MKKVGTAIGSGTADPAQAAATVAPVPPISVEDKPAPGQRGPKGLSPRTSYSRVNTGSPPVPDARGAAQKATPPRGMEFLPRKTAHVEDRMSSDIQPRPTIQDMLKAAMAGTLSKVDLTKEASIQAGNQGRETSREEVKTASPQGHIPTEQLMKLASAMDYIAVKVAEEGTNKNQPGAGPGALDVQAATSSEENIDAGAMGTATSQHVPPKTPAIQPEQTQSGKANTGLETNDDMQHGEQPVDPWGNEKGKVSSAAARVLALHKHAAEAAPGELTTGEKILAGGLGGSGGYLGARDARARGESALRGGAIGTLKGAPGAIAGAAGGTLLGGMAGRAIGGAPGEFIGSQLGSLAGGIGGGIGSYKLLTRKPAPEEVAAAEEAAAQEAAAQEASKGASAPIAYIRHFASERAKLAEDAINPAQISAGSATPPDESASEEKVPSQPSDVSSQQRMVASNEAAIDYTKRDAKADPKSDVNKVLAEPALTSSTDTTLNKVLDHTNEAGAKISSVIQPGESEKVAAVRALLNKLASDVAEDEKKKNEKKEKESQINPDPAASLPMGPASSLGPSRTM